MGRASAGLLGHWAGADLLLAAVSFFGLIAGWMGSGTVFVRDPERKRFVLLGILGGFLLGTVLCLIDNRTRGSFQFGFEIVLCVSIALGIEAALRANRGSWFSFFLAGGALGLVETILFPQSLPVFSGSLVGWYPFFLPVFWGGSRLLAGRKAATRKGRPWLKAILFLQIQLMTWVGTWFLLGWPG